MIKGTHRKSRATFSQHTAVQHSVYGLALTTVDKACKVVALLEAFFFFFLCGISEFVAVRPPRWKTKLLESTMTRIPKRDSPAKSVNPYRTV